MKSVTKILNEQKAIYGNALKSECLKKFVIRTQDTEISIPKEKRKATCSKDIAYMLDLIYKDLGTISVVETFLVLLFDRANNIIGYSEVSTGGVSACIVDPRIVLFHAANSLASGVCLAHNHPSCNITPSNVDRDLTRKLKDLLNLAEVTLLDHIIMVEGGKYYSFADEGRL